MRSSLAIVAAGAALMAAAGCGSSSSSDNSSDTAKLRIGLVGVEGLHLPLDVAIDQGFDKAHGVDVSTVQVQNPQAVSFLVGGSVDLSLPSTDAPILARAKGAKVKIVGGLATQSPYNIIATKSIKTLDELKGHSIAVPGLDTGSGLLLRAYLRDQGYNDSDFKLVVTGSNSDRYAALRAGHTDAAILLDPANFQAEAEGYNDLGAVSAGDLNYLAWTADEEWLGDHEDQVAEFFGALEEAIEWLKKPENHDKAVSIAKEALKIDDDIASQIVDYYTKQHPDSFQVTLTDSDVQGWGDFLGSFKLIPSDFDAADAFEPIAAK